MYKKLIAIGVILILLAFGGFALLPLLLDKETIKNQVISSFNAVTGLNLEIQGDARLEAFPVPHVVINSLYVRNAPDASSPFLLKVKLIDVRPALSSLFSRKLIISVLAIDGVVVEIERLKSGQMNWLDSNVRGQSGSTSFEATKGDVLNASSITIVNALVRYTNALTGVVSEYKDVGLSLVNGSGQSKSSLNLTMQYEDIPFRISGHLGNLSQAMANEAVPSSLNIISGKSSLTYEGDIGFKDHNLTMNGKTSLETDDVVPWISLFWFGKSVKPGVSDTHYKSLPLQAKSSVSTDNGKIVLPDLSLDGAIIKGTLQAAIILPARMEIRAAIDALDLETFFASKLFEPAEPGAESIKTEDPNNSFMPTAKSPLNALSLSADIKLADTVYNLQHIKDAHLNFDMTGEDMTIPEASATLPGETRAVFTGIGRKGYQGFTLEGQLDVAGNNFSELLIIFKSKGFALPAEDFKRFRIRTNAVISTKEVRFSEMAARIENMGVLGGIIATFAERTKLQAALRISGVNLDHFISLWGFEEWRASLSDNTPDTKKEGLLPQWLKLLGFNLQLNTSLDQFILNGKVRDKTDFKLEATAAKLAFNDIKTFYNGSTLSGNVGIDVSGVLPRIEANITANTLDTDVFFANDTASEPVNAQSVDKNVERWSRKSFDFSWLDLLNASYRLKCGHYKRGTLMADGLDIKGSIDNRTLNVDNLTADVLGGKISTKLALVGGKIPALTVTADITSIDAQQLAVLLPVFQGMTGKYNINLRLNSSGIDMFSWVSNLEGTMGLGGRNVTVHGFNMPGIVREVAYVRTVADILDVVKRAFPGGDTLFSSVTGEWLITNGMLKASNVKLNNGESDGVLAGQLDLINWKLQSKITFVLKTLDRLNPPSMAIGFAGDFDAPEKLLDTSSLEQYVTHKTSERMLNQYGTH